MPHLPFHPAPGSLRAITPGWYPVPQNPVVMANSRTSAVGIGPDGQYVTPYDDRGSIRSSLGAIVAGSYPVPQNPLRSWMKPASGMGCGCDSSCGCGRGMGQLDFTMGDILDGSAGTETYLVIGAAVLALVLLLGPGKKSYHSSRAQSAAKKAKVASAQSSYYGALAS